MITPLYKLFIVLLFCGNLYAQESEEFQEYDIFNQIITQICDSNLISIKHPEGYRFKHEVVEPRVWSYGYFIFPLKAISTREWIKDTIVIVCQTETDTNYENYLINFLKYQKEEELLSELLKKSSNKGLI